MYLFPPHPSISMKIPHSEVDKYEKMGGWVAQRKYNGSHFIGHLKNNLLTCWNRRGDPFTTYKLTSEMASAFCSLNVDPKIDYVFDGELLHTKAKSKIMNKQAVTNTVVLFDILYCGKTLLMETFLQRYEILKSLCGNPLKLESKSRALEVTKVNDSQIWLAEIFPNEFEYHFYEFYDFDKNGNDKYPEIEGLVLKRIKNSTLNLGKTAYDVNWMMRVRKPKLKTYQF